MGGTVSPKRQTERGPGGSLAEKIEWLVRHRWPADAPQPRTNADAALAITAATGVELSSTGFWKLRTGRGGNPQFDTLTAFARFFCVPLGFFGDEEDAEVLGDQAALAALLSGKGVTRAALRRFADLSGPGQRIVVDVIDSVARMEGERSGGDATS
jgi:hypothetical protein